MRGPDRQSKDREGGLRSQQAEDAVPDVFEKSHGGLLIGFRQRANCRSCDPSPARLVLWRVLLRPHSAACSATQVPSFNAVFRKMGHKRGRRFHRYLNGTAGPLRVENQ